MSTRSRQHPPVPKTWAEALALCPFRSLIGVPAGTTVDQAGDLMPRVSHTIAVLGGDPEPINTDTMAELAASIRSGGTVLLISDRADLRDYAKREILAMAGPTLGCA